MQLKFEGLIFDLVAFLDVNAKAQDCVSEEKMRVLNDMASRTGEQSCN
jgi:hypothetical protein